MKILPREKLEFAKNSSKLDFIIEANSGSVNGQLTFDVVDEYYRCRIKKVKSLLNINITDYETEKLVPDFINSDGTSYKVHDHEILHYTKESNFIR